MSEAVQADTAAVPHRQNPASYNQSGRPLRIAPDRPRPAAKASQARPGRMDDAAVLLVAMQNYTRLEAPPAAEPQALGFGMFDLETPRADIRRLARAFTALGAEVQPLIEPDRLALADACAALRETGRRHMVVYFAGAGGLRGADGCILIRGPVLAGSARPSVDFVSTQALADMVLPRGGSARHATLLIDSCLTDWDYAVPAEPAPSLIESLRRAERQDVALLYSAAYGQAAADFVERGNDRASPGAFALEDALRSGALTLGELSETYRRGVEALTQGEQTPQLFAAPSALSRAFTRPA